jgi:hypothetical protein
VGYDSGGPCDGVSSLVEEFTPYREVEVSVSYNGQSIKKWVHMPHPLPKVNFLMIEISTPKPYIFMVTRQIKCIIAQAPGSYPTPYLK